MDLGLHMYNNDWKLAKKLRCEDPEQFQTLVRMHLSFVLDLNTDDTDCPAEKAKFRPLKWGLVPFTKKMRVPVKGVMEGAPLTQEGICQVYQLIEFLSKEENVTQEGIFRRSGKMTRQQELKGLLNQGVTLKLDEGQFSVHDCASVLKSFLAELPEPLLTESYHPAYCQIAELCMCVNPCPSRLLCSLQLLLLLLPAQNWAMLKDIIRLLHLTASHQDKNKMTPENLATLFTPHLLCPRKLTPEALHTNAQVLSHVLAFMISAGADLFQLPSTLATDIRAYWERRKLQPKNINESVSESTTASTVFSFVDRERSAQEGVVNPTAAALAQLYAHIQALPESAKKRRLIKQFNRENGHSTPRTRSLGDSIKKHIFCKVPKAKVLDDANSTKNHGIPSDGVRKSNEAKPPCVFKKNLNFDKSLNDWKSPNCAILHANAARSCSMSPSKGSKGHDDTSSFDPSSSPSTPSPPPSTTSSTQTPVCHRYLTVSKVVDPVHLSPPLTPATNKLTPRWGTSTPACHNCLLTPSPLVASADDMSPITRSTQRMPRAMQEAMVTPRSRKPVVAVSGSNLCHLANLTWGPKEFSWPPAGENGKKPLVSYDVSDDESTEEDCLTSTFRDYLFSRSVLTTSPVDLSFSSRTGDFDPSTSEENLPSSPLSESLLRCLDGKSPPSPRTSRKRLSSGDEPSNYNKKCNSCDQQHVSDSSSSSSIDVFTRNGCITETSL